MPTEPPSLSIVVPTVGRVDDLARLLASLRGEMRPGDELILVDQNPDDRLVPVLEAAADLNPIHLRADKRGASHARNVGLARAGGDAVWFPDDDAWATPGLLDTLRRCLTGEPDISVFAGRSVDEAGAPSMNRWPRQPLVIDRGNVWRTAIEYTTLHRRGFFERIGGFRENVGVGAGTPWGAGEGQDLLLRGLAAGERIVFRPQIVVGHPRKFDSDSPAELAKAASYARGIGYVMGINGYSPFAMAPHLLKPLVAIGLYGIRGRLGRVRYYAGQLVNRWAGWRAGRRARRPEDGPTHAR